MNGMDKVKRILTTIVELVALLLLLETLGKVGMGVLLGEAFAAVAKIIIAFGVSIMSIFGVGLAMYLPTRRHRILRDTQVHVLKYTFVLGLYQILGLFITKSTALLKAGAIAGISPILMNVLMMTFVMIALMMPFNYVKSLFGLLKSVELRDPRKMIKQFFS